MRKTKTSLMPSFLVDYRSCLP